MRVGDRSPKVGDRYVLVCEVKTWIEGKKKRRKADWQAGDVVEVTELVPYGSEMCVYVEHLPTGKKNYHPIRIDEKFRLYEGLTRADYERVLTVNLDGKSPALPDGEINVVTPGATYADCVVCSRPTPYQCVVCKSHGDIVPLCNLVGCETFHSGAAPPPPGHEPDEPEFSPPIKPYTPGPPVTSVIPAPRKPAHDYSDRYAWTVEDGPSGLTGLMRRCCKCGVTPEFNDDACNPHDWRKAVDQHTGWKVRTADWNKPSRRRPREAPTELRCERDWLCGLVRTKR